jgi:hypothetical protein
MAEQLTPEQKQKALDVISAIADYIQAMCEQSQKRGLPGLPSGELYAVLMATGMGYMEYQSFIGTLQNIGAIRVKNNCIIWQGLPRS